MIVSGSWLPPHHRSGLRSASSADNERFALLLAEKGADIMQVNEFMTTVKGQSRNWVGGSVMTKYGAISRRHSRVVTRSLTLLCACSQHSTILCLWMRSKRGMKMLWVMHHVVMDLSMSTNSKSSSGVCSRRLIVVVSCPKQRSLAMVPCLTLTLRTSLSGGVSCVSLVCHVPQGCLNHSAFIPQSSRHASRLPVDTTEKSGKVLLG